MGKISILTKEQKSILDEIKNNQFLRQTFYFTGGTALSCYYLKHRYSEDLDFFSNQKIDQELIIGIVENWQEKYKFKIQSNFVEVVYRFNLTFPNKYILKLDFGYYPYKNLDKRRNEAGMMVDSLTDIAVNKLLAITQRTDVKDFIDLYFLLKKFTVWDLLEGLRVKFRRKTDLEFFAIDFLKAEDFNIMPRMIKKLDLATLKVFFREKAKILGKKAVI